MLDFQETLFKHIKQIHLFGASSAGVEKVCFEDLNKEVFLKPKMQTVVE